MKTIHTELGHITDLLNRLALSHPQIRFEATHNGKTLFKTAGTGDVLQVIAQVYGMGVAKKMLPIEHETLDFSIKGYIAKPEITRASRSYISTIINGRYIKSVALTQAIIRAYHTLLPIGRSPLVVISINMDPILVDVNVHPTKLEVRFSKEKELFSAIEEVIKLKFRETTLIPEMVKKVQTKDMSVQNTLQFDDPETQDNRQFNEMIREQQAMIDEWTVPSESKIQKDSNDTSEMTISFDDETSDSIPAQEVKHVQKGNSTTDRVPAM